MNDNEYMRKYMAKRYRQRMDDAIEYLGGKCVDCGSQEDLEFDHGDRSSKVMNVSQSVTYSKKKFWAEVEKCQLRCRECHNKKTLNELGFQDGKVVHGTLAAGRYCKCEECRKAKSDYMKDYYRKRLRSSTGGARSS